MPYRNAPDFASRASNPGATVLPQLISVPLGFSIVSFIGIIVSSSSQTIYGEAVWSPIDLLGRFLDGEPSHATRFGVRGPLLPLFFSRKLEAASIGVVHCCCFHYCAGMCHCNVQFPQLTRGCSSYVVRVRSSYGPTSR